MVNVGEEFELPFGQTVRIAGTEVSAKFSRVVRDGRCPSDVVCGIRGSIKIELAVKHQDGRTQNLVLSDVEHETEGQNAFGLTYDLKGVMPWPTMVGTILEHEYIATIEVAHAR